MSKTETEDAQLQLVGDALLRFAAEFPGRVFTNAYTWVWGAGRYVSIHGALVGSARKVAAYFGHMATMNEEHEFGMSGQVLDHIARRVFGADADIFRYERRVHLAEFLQRLANLMPEEATLTFIPDGGYPWPVDRYWNARLERFVRPKEPAGLIHVPSRENPTKTELGLDPCTVFEADRDTPVSPYDPVMGSLGGDPLMAAHSMDLHEGPTMANAPKIRQCGGLLFPSLSVGPVPASNFGHACLVARLSLVLDGLKPYRKRGTEEQVWIYPTDVWTGTVTQFMTSMASDLFDELHGHADYVYGHGLTVLGIPAVEYGGPSGGAEAFDSTSQLKRTLKKRMVRWMRVCNEREFEELAHELGGTGAYYAYCEAKGRTVVSLSEFPYLIVPDWMRDKAEHWAQAAGFEGQIVAPQWPYTLDRGGGSWDMWQWALKVSETVAGLRPVVEVR